MAFVYISRVHYMDRVVFISTHGKQIFDDECAQAYLLHR